MVATETRACRLTAVIAQLDRTFLRAAPGRAASRLVGYMLFEGRPLTTKGRWWNPIVFSNLRAAAHSNGRPVAQPVFIVGMGRSGTTLLGRILAAHRDVGFLNEPKAMWHVIRDDEDIIGSYAPPHTGRLYLGSQDANQDVIQRANALYYWYLRASHSRRVVDKYPELIFRHSFVRAIFPDAHFLIAVRSPWSTLPSVATWSQTHASHNADWWGLNGQKWDILWRQGVVEKNTNADLAALDLANENSDLVRAAVEWIIIMREAISLLAIDPLAQLVRYEELARHPREAVREMLQFCGLPASPRTETYAEAVVSPKQSHNDRHRSRLPIPGALASLLDDTWATLNAIEISH